MLQQSSAPAPSRLVPGRRAAARLRLSVPARFESIFGTQDCYLLDLSRTGARIALADPLGVGAEGFLRVGPLELFGQAVHASRFDGGGINGLAFDEPIADEVVLAMRHHAETFEDERRAALHDRMRQWVKGEI